MRLLVPPKVQYLISLSLGKGEERLHTNRVESVSVLVFKDEIVILSKTLMSSHFNHLPTLVTHIRKRMIDEKENQLFSPWLE